MDSVSANVRNEVLFVYTQRLIPGRRFEAIGNLGTLTLAARLNSLGYRAESFTGITTDLAKLIDSKYDRLLAVCFYCDFDNHGAIASLCAHYEDAPFYKLMGGPHTMHLSSEDYDKYHVDAILCGDGEESIPAWLAAHETPLPEEITAESDGQYTLLDDFTPYPYADDETNIGIRTNVFTVITARGCPHRCAFCFEGGNSKKLRIRPVAEVLAEIEARLLSGRNNYLFFADDTFTFDIKRLEEMCLGLAKLRESYDFVWFCEGHASFFKKYPQAVAMMVDAGLVRLQIGMESGNDDILAAYGKGIKAEDILHTADLCRDAHLPQLVGNFIIGGAFEDENTLAQTRELMKKLIYDYPGMVDISTTFPIPLPGTELVMHPEKYGIIWNDTEFVTSLEDIPVNRTEKLSVAEICNARRLFIHELVESMKDVYAKGMIPAKVIDETYRLAKRYSISNCWLEYIYRKADQRLKLDLSK